MSLSILPNRNAIGAVSLAWCSAQQGDDTGSRGRAYRDAGYRLVRKDVSAWGDTDTMRGNIECDFPADFDTTVILGQLAQVLDPEIRKTAARAGNSAESLSIPPLLRASQTRASWPLKSRLQPAGCSRLVGYLARCVAPNRRA